MNDKDGFQGRAEGEIAEQALAKIAEQQIIQTAKTKRFLIAMVGFMFVVAALVILLAPDGREKTAIWLGIVLAILALGIKSGVENSSSGCRGSRSTREGASAPRGKARAADATGGRRIKQDLPIKRLSDLPSFDYPRVTLRVRLALQQLRLLLLWLFFTARAIVGRTIATPPAPAVRPI